MYEEQHGESEYAYLIFNYCQKQECFPFKDCMQTEQTALHLRPLNTSTNIKTRQLSQNIFRSVVVQTSVF